jgi:hypothetical protein
MYSKKPLISKNRANELHNDDFLKTSLHQKEKLQGQIHQVKRKGGGKKKETYNNHLFPFLLYPCSLSADSAPWKVYIKK